MTAEGISLRERLRVRAELVCDIAAYFQEQGVVPVTTRLLSAYGSTDPTIENLIVEAGAGGPQFLQTSPEFAMKRLVAAGSGDIYQICPAFRGGEQGRLHQCEFTMLEWYRLGFDHHRLMDDVEALVKRFLGNHQWRRSTYSDLASAHLDIDPLAANNTTLADIAGRHVDLSEGDSEDRALLLDIVFSCELQPRFEPGEAVFVYDFPIEHAAYARIRHANPPVAERFELIVDGIELANGYHEVTAASEQSSRHALENVSRRQRGLPAVTADPIFLSALADGMPACAGVALGIDRLLMLVLGAQSLAEVQLL